MRVALTGSTGFLGQRIAGLLHAQGHQLVCLVREQSDPSHLLQLGAQVVRGDLSQDSALAQLVQGCDTTVHAAVWSDTPSLQQVGTVHPIEHYQQNLLGSLRLLGLSRQHCRQFIFISSGAVYGNPPGDEPLTEDSPRDPADSYGAYKASVEMFCHAAAAQFAFNACALRPFPIIGMHDPIEASPFYDLVRRVVAGERVEARGTRKFVRVEDVARAVPFVLGREDVKGQVYNLCDGWVHLQEIAEWARQISGSAAQIISSGPPRIGHEVPSDKIRAMGFQFGGRDKLREYVAELVHGMCRR